MITTSSAASAPFCKHGHLGSCVFCYRETVPECPWPELLAHAPDADLFRETAKRMRARRTTGKPKTMTLCPRCGKMVSARAMRKRCPHFHESPNAPKEKEK